MMNFWFYKYTLYYILLYRFCLSAKSLNLLQKLKLSQNALISINITEKAIFDLESRVNALGKAIWYEKVDWN